MEYLGANHVRLKGKLMKNSISLLILSVILFLLVLGCNWLDRGLEDDVPLQNNDQVTEKLEKEKQELDEKNRKLEEKIATLEKEKQTGKTQPKAAPQQNQDNHNQGNQRQRHANSPGDGWLALRSQPSSSSRLLAKIPHGTKLTQQSCNRRVKSGKLYGRWCRIQYKNMSGWAFDYYLR